MANKNFKIAIMGASGVGKSVFLGSYFFLNIHRGGCRHSVEITDARVNDNVQDLTDKLFQKSEQLAGTEGRNELSFHVPDMGMDVELFDVKGGDTTNSDLFKWWNMKTRNTIYFSYRNSS